MNLVINCPIAILDLRISPSESCLNFELAACNHHRRCVIIILTFPLCLNFWQVKKPIDTNKDDNMTRT